MPQAKVVRTKVAGRVKGTPNKVSASAKENVIHVFNMLGGSKAFCAWAKENQTEFYRHYAKLLPTKVEGSGENGEHVFKAEISLTINGS
jgi:hypothetical protein